MNIKKIAALLMALILAMTMLLAGCGEDETKKDDDKKEETTVNADNDIDVDVGEDEEVEDEEAPLYAPPGTEGFTLDGLKRAIELYVINQYDVEFLNQYVLAESNAILEYMLANDVTAGNAEFEEEEGSTSITEMFGYSDVTAAQSLNTIGIDIVFANDGNWYVDEAGELDYSDEGDIEGEQIENAFDYYVGTYAPDYYDVAAEAVANAYAGSDENVEFVNLSVVACMPYVDDGVYGGTFEIFIIETNTGWFLLYEI